MAWTDEKTERLKQLYADGLSCGEIARRLGGVTRNAVLGKVHRIGLPLRGLTRPGTRPKPVQRLRRKPLKRPAVRPVSPIHALFQSDGYVPPAEDLVIPLNERKTIATLTDKCCRWPIGDPQQPEFHFCGKKKIPGLPYCEAHARRAYQPPQPRRRDLPVVAAATKEVVAA